MPTTAVISGATAPGGQYIGWVVIAALGQHAGNCGCAEPGDRQGRDRSLGHLSP